MNDVLMYCVKLFSCYYKVKAFCKENLSSRGKWVLYIFLLIVSIYNLNIYVKLICPCLVDIYFLSLIRQWIHVCSGLKCTQVKFLF